MKNMKRILSVLLCCVLLAAFAPMVHAEDVLIEKAMATYTVPAAGEPFDFGAVTVPVGAHYSAEIKDAYYQKDGKWEHISSGDAVIAGARYSVRIRFYADSGYKLDDTLTEYTVNGEVTSAAVGANLVETTFVAADKTPDEPEPSKPTFRDRVATFFRDMRNRILAVIFFIRHLFGIKM